MNHSLRACALLISISAIPQLSVAQEITGDTTDKSNDVVRVEEDWEIYADTSDSEKTSPLFQTVFPIDQSHSFLITWNHRTEPFAEGGYSIQLWQDDQCIACQQYPGEPFSGALKARWTQVVRTNGDQVTISLANVQSPYWPIKAGSLTVNLKTPNFNNYTPAASMQESDISYGKNRVEWFQIKGYRMYNAAGILKSGSGTDVSLYERK
jgi:hypothetical protein